MIKQIIWLSDDLSKSTRAKWSSAAQIAKAHVGGAVVIGRKIRGLRSALICELMEQRGLPMGNAAEIVSDNLIGWRDSHGGQSRRTLSVSDDALRMLDLKPRSQTRISGHIAEPGWKSASQLRDEYKGNITTLNFKLERFRDSIVNDIKIRCDASKFDVLMVVDDNLVGLRGNAAGGPKTLHVSPSVILLLEQEGVLRRKVAAHSPDTGGDHIPSVKRNGPSR